MLSVIACRSDGIFLVAVDEDRHVAVTRLLLLLTGTRFEALGTGFTASISGGHVAGQLDDVAGVDLAGTVDVQRHYLPAKEGVASFQLDVRGSGSGCEPALDRDLCIDAFRAAGRFDRAVARVAGL